MTDIPQNPAQIRADYEAARRKVDDVALEVIRVLEEKLLARYQIIPRFGFEIDGTPDKNQRKLLTKDEIKKIRQRYTTHTPTDYVTVGAPAIPDGGGASLDSEEVVASSYLDRPETVIDKEIADFEYNFLEYQIKTGALHTEKAIKAVEKARAAMQEIAKEHGFGKFRFTAYEPDYSPNQPVNPMHTNLSLWRQCQDRATGTTYEDNVTFNPTIRDYHGCEDAMNIYRDGMLFLAPREISYHRFQNQNPSTPRYFYVNHQHGKGRQGAMSFHAERRHSARVELRLPSQDTCPSAAAMLTLLATYHGLSKHLIQDGHGEGNLVGDLDVSYDYHKSQIPRTREIAQNRFDAQHEGNTCLAAMRQHCGKDLADKMYATYRDFLAKQQAYDHVLEEEYRASGVETKDDPKRFDVSPLLDLLRGLRTKNISHDLESNAHGIQNIKDGAAPDILPLYPMRSQHEALLQTFFDGLRPIVQEMMEIAKDIRGDVQALSFEKRNDVKALAKINGKHMRRSDKAYGALLGYIDTALEATFPNNTRYMAKDTERAWNVGKYITNAIVEQSMGDLIMPQNYGAVWPNCPAYLMSDETHRRAERDIQHVLDAIAYQDIEKDKKRSMRGLDALGEIAASLRERRDDFDHAQTPLAATAALFAQIQAECDKFRDIDATDIHDVTQKFGNHVTFAGVSFSTKEFVADIGFQINTLLGKPTRHSLVGMVEREGTVLDPSAIKRG